MHPARHLPTLRCIVGDITTVACDAIINPSNTALFLGAGVSGRIRERGGSSIQTAMSELAPIAHGHAVWTHAGELTNCRAIIHAAVLDARSSEVKIRESAYHALVLAQRNGFHRVVFPAMGTGVGSVLPRIAAQEMLCGIRAFLNDFPDSVLTHITFAVLDRENFEAFRSIITGQSIADAAPSSSRHDRSC